MSHNAGANSTESILPCLSNNTVIDADETPDLVSRAGTWQIHPLHQTLQ